MGCDSPPQKNKKPAFCRANARQDVHKSATVGQNKTVIEKLFDDFPLCQAVLPSPKTNLATFWSGSGENVGQNLMYTPPKKNASYSPGLGANL